jgi:redox-sensing transcriptional repressor
MDSKLPTTYPLPTIRRLPHYLRYMRGLQRRGLVAVPGTTVARYLNIDSTQVRKDLACIGLAGKPRIGFDLAESIDVIEDFLGWGNTSDVFLVGTGNLGRALISFDGFSDRGVQIIAAFDSDGIQPGTRYKSVPVYPVSKCADLVSRLKVSIAFLCVPAPEAQKTAAMLGAAGITAIWNFTPVKLDVSDSIIVEDVNMCSSLALLTSRLTSNNNSGERRNGDNQRNETELVAAV